MDDSRHFASRLGFILVTAGCAIGLGNVWRFPFIAGQSGGAIFLFAYLFFLLAAGIPLMTVELAIGRASGKSVMKAFSVLRGDRRFWGIISVISVVGEYILMSYYTVITGWLVYYSAGMIAGKCTGIPDEAVAARFAELTGDPWRQFLCAALVMGLVCAVCYRGIQKGVENFVKPMMFGMMLIMAVMVAHSFTLEGAAEGVAFLLKPDLTAATEIGWWKVVCNALTQVFFSLSIGIGSVLIFGAYIPRNHSLTKEAVIIAGLDTAVAVLAGFIIFPACFTFNISPDAGPTLVFQTMPLIFNKMAGGGLWGALFFVFLAAAAISTVVAVVESIIKCCMELFGWSRHLSSVMNFFILTGLSLPVILGFNRWSFVQPLGQGSTVLDLFDFIVSCNLLPIGALLMIMFCVCRCGWGWRGFTDEVNAGAGVKMPAGAAVKYYFRFVLTVLIIVVTVASYGAAFG